MCREDPSHSTVLPWVRWVASLCDYYFSFLNKYELLLNWRMIAGGLSSRNYFQADKYTEHNISTCISGKHHACLFKDSLTWYGLNHWRWHRLFHFITFNWIGCVPFAKSNITTKKRSLAHLSHNFPLLRTNCFLTSKGKNLFSPHPLPY